MIIRNCTLDVLENLADEKQLVCFGAGKVLDELEEFCAGKWDILKKCDAICDNDKEKQGKRRIVCGRELTIISMEQLRQYDKKNLVLLITVGAYVEIVEQLRSIEWFSDVEVFIFNLVKNYQLNHDSFRENTDIPKAVSKEEQIPKVIHYIWMGENMPDDMKRCVDSWYRLCPDYEIKLWNEQNYDFTKNQYMKKAYENEIWGFVVDYARLDIVYHEGGIYLDTDVEVIKPLDELRKEEAFIAYQPKYVPYQPAYTINAGSGFGAVKKHKMIKTLRDAYDHIKFNAQDLSKNVPSPNWQTKTLKEYGLKCDGSYQIINGLTVFPFQVLCCRCYASEQSFINKDSYCIHHFAGTWEKGKKASLEEEILKESIANVITVS